MKMQLRGWKTSRDSTHDWKAGNAGWPDLEAVKHQSPTNTRAPNQGVTTAPPVDVFAGSGAVHERMGLAESNIAFRRLLQGGDIEASNFAALVNARQIKG